MATILPPSERAVSSDPLPLSALTNVQLSGLLKDIGLQIGQHATPWEATRALMAKRRLVTEEIARRETLAKKKDDARRDEAWRSINHAYAEAIATTVTPMRPRKKTESQ